MDFKQIQELIKLINKSNIGELSIEENDFKITIKQKEEQAPVYSSAFSSQPSQNAIYHNQPMQASAPVQAPPATSAEQSAPEPKSDSFVTIKSPMIGTFYRSTAPDKPAFVSVGDEITVGKSVCIIEAMKLFNEIESEVAGKIVKILAEDASPVEYDQPLFLVDPS